MNHASAFDTTVTYSLGGTAGEGSDYATITTHSVTILAGSTSTTVSIDPTTDTVFEGNETILLTLTGGSSGTGTVTPSLVNGSATGTITDDDASAAPFSLDLPDLSSLQGNGLNKNTVMGTFASGFTYSLGAGSDPGFVLSPTGVLSTGPNNIVPGTYT